MIKLIDGDLIKDGPLVIAHQVNCKGVMGKGLANTIRQNYPMVYGEYQALCCSQAAHQDTRQLLGEIQVTYDEVHERIVANLFGQNNYGTGRMFTDINALRKAFTNLKALVLHNKDEYPCFKQIGIPHGIGCGLGGEKWERVFSMLVDVFGDEEEIELLIFKLK